MGEVTRHCSTAILLENGKIYASGDSAGRGCPLQGTADAASGRPGLSTHPLTRVVTGEDGVTRVQELAGPPVREDPTKRRKAMQPIEGPSAFGGDPKRFFEPPLAHRGSGLPAHVPDVASGLRLDAAAPPCLLRRAVRRLHTGHPLWGHRAELCGAAPDERHVLPVLLRCDLQRHGLGGAKRAPGPKDALPPNRDSARECAHGGDDLQR